jgi:hypothetical protein
LNDEPIATEFSVEDETNPRSVVCLTSQTPSLYNAIKEHLFTHPEYFEMEYHDLSQKANPSFTLSRLRLSFWNEYENAIQNNRKMSLGKILAGVCTDTVFRKSILDNPLKMAYILSPPKDYMVTVKEALDAGLDNVRAIVGANVFLADGKTLNVKAAEVVLKAVALLDMRVKGAVIQRIDQRSVNLNVNKDVTPRSPSGLPQSLEELERQLDEIKLKMIRDVTQSRLPSAPIEIQKTMKELNVELIDTGGSFKLKND